jgi:hypothetical protein
VQGFSFDKEHPYAAGQRRGIDIGSSGGIPVLAPASGTVTFAGVMPESGMCVTIETADGLAVTLTHLGSVTVGKGAAVAEGATVGAVGTGAGSEGGGPYVHLGIRVASDPNGYLDPLTLLPPATTVGSPSSTPAPGPAPAAQQSSATSAPQVVAASATTTVSSGTSPNLASGPPAKGASAPVEVPATDFARHAVPASSMPASSPVARIAPTTSAAGTRDRRTAVVVAPPASPARAARARTRGRVPSQRDGRAQARRSATLTAAASVARLRPALDAVDGTDLSPASHARRAQSARVASRSRAPAAPRRLTSRTAFAGGALVALLILLGALFRRRRRASIAPPQEEAVVLALPRSLGPEPLRHEQRLAA